ncbi:MAG: type VI secretion system tip protein TssI/VgrG [Polyangiaceae bacterium]
MEPTYHLVVHGAETEPLSVMSFRARETMSACYEVTMECVADATRDMTEVLLGRRATLLLNVADPPQVFHGVIHSISLVGAGHASGVAGSGDAVLSATYSVTLAPRLWLLRKRRRSRIFQRLRVDEIVKQVLKDADIPVLFNLQRPLPVREYCTQYEETDEEFIRRILAEAGIMFFFLQPALPGPVDAAANLIETILGALSSLPLVGDALNSFGVGSLTGEVVFVTDDPIGYAGIGELPEGIDSLIQAAVGAAGNAIADATGPIGGEIISAAKGVAGAVLSSARTSKSLRYRPPTDGLVLGDRDVVHALSLGQTMTTDSVIYTVFDPRRPLRPLSFTAAGDALLGGAVEELASLLPGEVAGVVQTVAGIAQTAASVAGAAGLSNPVLSGVGAIAKQLGATGRNDLTIHEHHDPFLLPDWDYAKTEPRRILDGERRDRRVGRGESPSPELGCGRRFTLVEHPIEWVNREYVVVEVHHEGHAYAGMAAHADKPVYMNKFVCVPSEVPYAPVRPRRQTIQTCHTATVIATGAKDDVAGTAGGSAEVATTGSAEIKVRFHWEQSETGTCWVRTMHAWGGVGWGAQFMPRTGMEVVVGFEGGDPDRPIVLGCVYNAIHPPPFALPKEQTKSGIRTQSTPGGEGFNELSFEDQQGAERFYMHAERDMLVEVERDRTAVVLHDDVLRVDNEQRITVNGPQSFVLDGGQDTVVRERRRLEVEGTDEHTTRGERRELVIGSLTTEVRGTHRGSYGGGAGDVVQGDYTRDTSGCSTEVVRKSKSVRVEGTHESSSKGPTLVESEKEIVLRCGDSSVRIASSSIELVSPAIMLSADGAFTTLKSGKISQSADSAWQALGNTIVLASSGASVGLSSEAQIDGSKILLNSPDSASDSVKPDKPKLTTIELKDQKGKPIPNQRFRVELADGTARTGKLNEEGRAEIALEGSAEIVFPDLSEVTAS